MAKSCDPNWDRVVKQLNLHYGMYDKMAYLELAREITPTPKELLEMMQENKRLKLLVDDLQKEIEFMVLESQETHELEEK